MTPYYDKDGIVIYHGDCHEIMPALETGIADLVLTDPPYGIGYVTARRSRTHRLVKPIAGDGGLESVAEAWPEAMRLLKDNRHWYAFASPRMIPDASRALGGSKQTLCWDKGDRGTVGDLEFGFGEAWEAIFYGMKGRRAINGKRPRTVLRYDWSSTMDPVHPTVKPVPLLERMIAWSTDPGEVVFDPYMGSGTTLRAAKNQGRRAIGIELEERYCETAVKRMAQGVFDFGQHL